MPLLRPDNPLSAFEAELLRNRAFEIILNKSFSKGQFKLTSGKESNYYLDMKPTMFDPDGADALSRMVLDRLKDMSVDYIGGLEIGAVPLISTIAMLSHQQKTPLPGFFVRKAIKGHGTMKLIEGLENGALNDKKVVVLDDVTTSGRSAMVAAKAAEDDGARVILVLAIVDRQEGAAELFRAAGVPFTSLFTAEEFMAAA